MPMHSIIIDKASEITSQVSALPKVRNSEENKPC